MNQTAQCSNCKTSFETPGVLFGKTSAVICPKCRRPVIVRGEMDSVDPEPTPAPATALKKGKDETTDHAWKVRSEYDRPVVEREAAPEPEPEPPASEAGAPRWKLMAAAALLLLCISFMLARIFHGSAADPVTLARIAAAKEAFEGLKPVVEDGVNVAVIPEVSARALSGLPPQQICMNALYQGVHVQKVRSQGGVLVADCTALGTPPSK